MLCLSPEAAAAVARHAEATYPAECVGLLLGRAQGDCKMALRALALENRWLGQDDLVAHDPVGSLRDRFCLDPRDYLQAEYAARAVGLEVVGCYHSHPDAPATPSLRDWQGAAGGGSGFAFVIQAVYGGSPGELASWLLLDPALGFVAEDVVIVAHNGVG